MKRNWLLTLIALILVIVYAVFFTDWWQPKTIEIFHTSRMLPARKHRKNTPDAQPVLIFGINRALRPTDIKVVPLEAYKTNQNTLPLWHLVADSNSVPIKAFTYGLPIRGLKPAVAGIRADPLTNGVTYRIIVEADNFKGEHDFELK